MSVYSCRATALALVLLARYAAGAQAPKMAFPPPRADVSVSQDVQFGASGAAARRMDVYQLPRVAGRVRPALIFFNRANGADRRWALYDAWARAAASHDLVGILPDLRDASEAQDFRSLIAYLSREAR